MLHEMREFRANLQGSLVSFKTHDSRDYVVAPCVALVPGVLNRDLVTMQSIAGSWRAWNGRPLVLDHPIDVEGHPVSANQPAVLANVGMGYIFNSDIDDNRLRVEAWLDIDKSKLLGGDAQKVVELVKNGGNVEVSTGYWASLTPMKGIYNGREYDHITDMILPDHLALLPNAVGACNWADGCGIPRANQEEAVDEKTIREIVGDSIRRFMASFRGNMTVTDQFQALSTLIAEEMNSEGIDSWRWHMVDIEDNYVIIGMDNMFKRRPFTSGSNGNVSLSGEWETVHQQTTFVPMSMRNQCATCQAAITAQAEGDPEPAPTPQPDPTPPPTPEPEPEEPQPEKPDTEEQSDEEEEEEVMAEAVDTLQQFMAEHNIDQVALTEAIQARNNRRAEMCDYIKANSTLTDEDLVSLSDKVLETMAGRDYIEVEAVPGGVSETVQPVANYAGRGMPSQPVQQAAKIVKRPEVLRRVG